MHKAWPRRAAWSGFTWRPLQQEMRKWRRGSPATEADRGEGWTTIEEPIEIAAALLMHAKAGRVVVVDCLTLWLSNLILAGRDPGSAVTALADAIGRLAGPMILVSNEVGMGIVPDHKLGREFRDWQGRANREIGAVCDAVIFVAAGLPLQLKPATTPKVQLG